MKYSVRKHASSHIITLLSVLITPITASSQSQNATKNTINSSPNASKQSIPQLKQPQPVAVLPFDFDNDHIMVKVKIGDSENPFLFGVDTGASFSVINRDAAKLLGMRLRDVSVMSILGIKVRAPMRAEGYGEKGYPLKSAEHVRLHIASEAEDVTPAQSTYIVTSLPRARSGQSVDGILGYDFLKKYVVAIDYVNRKLSLYNRKGYRYYGKGQAFALDVTDDAPLVHATIKPLGGEPIPVRIFLDTGDGGSIGLATPFVNRRNLLGTTASFPFSSTGPAGTISGREGYLDSISIGRFTLPHPPADFFQSKGGAAGSKRQEGGLGNAILCRFNVVINLEDEYMYLEPNADFAKPFDPVLYSGLNSEMTDEGYLIKSVDAGSPAASAGFLPGDVLLAIDNTNVMGLSAKAFSLQFRDQSIHHYLVSRAGKEITLDMQRIAL